MRFEECFEKHSCLTKAIEQDVGVLADCERMVKESISGLGGLDIIISNAGWTKMSEFGDLHALSEADWDKVCIHYEHSDRSSDY